MKHCVVEIQDNVVIGLSICQDDKQAREIFIEAAQEATDLNAEEIEAALKDGVVEVGDGSLCLYEGHEIPLSEDASTKKLGEDNVPESVDEKDRG